ncbi:hypothetical protein F7725_007532 [Dissostichus mawsoni]|uniref:Transposase n=1 Tax=Dissostichus mawsoni TaxID=36200 RepID=A0A7J5Y6P7_DISMA|nr:hypothetical protein F7725_007532 [Dissostichus mawsoni]
MPKNRQRNNKLEPAAEASDNANLADDADINDQHVVLNAIASLKQDLVAKIEEKAIAQSAELQIQTTQIRTELRSVVEQVNKRIEVTEGRVSELEAEVSNHSDSITCMTSDVTGMKKELATLRDRCEDLEARSRRCNIRIIGVKEGREHGKHPSQFVADMLKVSLGLDKPPTLDRAHHALRSRATQDGLHRRLLL